ncbi:MAG: hypothetical protein AAFX02_00885 [Pseudomonadota bacterium]
MNICDSGPNFLCELTLLYESLLFALAPLVVVIFLSASIASAFLLVSMLVQRLSSADIVYLFIVFFSLSAVGTVSGFSAGMSRAAAVGAVVPAVLSLIGGVVIYLFGASNTRKLLPALGATALVLGLILGLSTGSNMRGRVSGEAGEEQQAQASLPSKIVCAEIVKDLTKNIAGQTDEAKLKALKETLGSIADRCNQPFEIPK